MNSDEMRALYGAELAELVAGAPELSPAQIREIRAIWLGVVTRRALTVGSRTSVDREVAR